ncbi:hypothetical protein GCM10009091_32630 [Pseudomonas brenneri]|uniref:Berberine/berberine-like domain-containing protein n=1 Tax=Pseudomonas brenneri TaxID=129817 RepID=A0A5B2UVA0_9PSED|nr:hypothetical protein F1720_10235 [Pseudomonas brenneri]TWR77248.1 hypothetical protein FJD34_16280 [Pseudomonas brenneri]GGL48271.1 hypothetical protein GCM10009091_32630 [Pseudomonas brenneri]
MAPPDWPQFKAKRCLRNPGRFNYPDVDMLTVNGAANDSWLELYYGNSGLVEDLILLKNQVDPKNLFRHQMSIPLARDKNKQ